MLKYKELCGHSSAHIAEPKFKLNTLLPKGFSGINPSIPDVEFSQHWFSAIHL